jgi:hypothetical protein
MNVQRAVTAKNRGRDATRVLVSGLDAEWGIPWLRKVF